MKSDMTANLPGGLSATRSKVRLRRPQPASQVESRQETNFIFCQIANAIKIQEELADTKKLSHPPNHKGIAMPSDLGFLFDGPGDAPRTIVLAHGAGAAMDTAFMNFFAAELARKGFRVARFEFPYMDGYRKTGKKKPPDREPVLRGTWIKVVDVLGAKNLVIGGKSMGGRIASLIADDAGVAGLICLGYPFHPVGKPEQLRVEHLRGIKTPTLVLQGERDPFGSHEEVSKYKLSRAIQIRWIEDGDHGFKPRKSSGTTERQNWEAALGEIESYLATI
jgi:predicted alpha/beta-hydrolase family hydrolase